MFDCCLCYFALLLILVGLNKNSFFFALSEFEPQILHILCTFLVSLAQLVRKKNQIYN